LTSKWFAWKSSWFCLNNNRRIKSARTYHAFLKHKRSSSKRQFLHIRCEVASSFDCDCVSAFELFSFSFSKLRFINYDSTQWKRIRWASWSFFCSIKNAMRNFKERETKTSFIIAIFSTISRFTHFASSRKMKVYLTYFFFSSRLRIASLRFLRENFLIVFIIVKMNWTLVNNSFIYWFIDDSFSSRFSFLRIRDHLQITITHSVEDFSFARRFSRVFCEMSFKIKRFVTMNWTSDFTKSIA
jgi:hypothetical protein